MTPLNKPVRRRSEELMRDRSKFRRIIVTLYPAGYMGFRLEKCQKEETLSMHAAYECAVRSRIALERKQKAEKKGNRYMAKRGKVG